MQERLGASVMGMAWCTDQLCQTGEYYSICRKDWGHQWWEWHDVQINYVRQVSTIVYAEKIGGISDGEWHDVQINYARLVSTWVYAGKIGGITDGEWHDVQINYVTQVSTKVLCMQERLEASVMRMAWCIDQLYETDEYQSICRKDWGISDGEWHDV